MDIQEFISKYENHPVLFVGTGISLRYLESSYTWDGLLKHICQELKGNNEFYLDIKSQCHKNGLYQFDQAATIIEEEFNSSLIKERDGKFKYINDLFYEGMENGVNLSRLKIYISSLLESISPNKDKEDEIALFKKMRKNISSVITTNYDLFIEETFDFLPLVGNDILLSNPYGSVYKIHGCITKPEKVIITSKDYDKFNEKYELIRAQLLSIFIHNPIIFLGYGIGDENIKNILKTIFTYVEPNSETAEKIRNNFLLVEYEKDSSSNEISEHDIELEGFSTIRINKIKTDDFSEIYKSIANLTLPVSAMDIRKVQNIVKDIYSGGDIKVTITEDLENLHNNEKILAIGSSKTIHYQYLTTAEIMSTYFDIIDESNSQILELINKQTIQSQQYFPIFGFSIICDTIQETDRLKEQQITKIEHTIETLTTPCQTTHASIDSIYNDASITISNKVNAIFWSVYHDQVSIDETESFLRTFQEKTDTPYRKLLCLYDYKKYGHLQ